MRTLVFGSMPDGATPLTHLASGPWCFAGREDRFPGWDDAPYGPDQASCGRRGAPPGRDKAPCPGAGPDSGSAAFPMPDDPYPDARSMEAEARAANGEVLRLIRLLGNEADANSGRRRSGRYWQMALGPFLLPAVHMLAERQRRVADLIARHGGEPLRLELLPEDIPFSFRSTLDFMLHGIQNTKFNHYVFSRIAEAALAGGAPPPWRVSYLPAAPLRQARDGKRQPLAARYADRLRRLLRDLPFPRYKGFSLGQALLLSLAVLGNKGGAEDNSLDFSLYGAKGFVWRFPAEKLIRACLPLDLQKGMRSAPPGRNGAKDEPRAKKHPLRGMTPAFSQDDAYRLRLADLRESGCRLFCVQHGANYGNLLSVGILPFEYCQHAFFTWGWTRHEGQPVNALPLPHPLLTAVCNAHRETAPRLILVGTEMSPYAYRLKSRPQAKAMLTYRAGKIAFFRTLLDAFADPARPEISPHSPGDPARHGVSPHSPGGPALHGPELLYRPYFKVAGGLDDAEHVLARLPGVGLCAGDLTAHMLGCRLLVLDHYGTTLHMALAADTPTLAFWNRREWGMEPESDRVLDALQEAGILHASPEAAARRAAAVWDHPAVWWKSPPVRQARALWLQRYARVGDSPEQPWSGRELTRRWFRALRKC